MQSIFVLSLADIKQQLRIRCHTFASVMLPLLLSSILLSSCSGTSYNESTFPFHISDAEALEAISTVVIANVNGGPPSKHYLAKYESAIDKFVASYLKQHGYRLHSSQAFDAAWRQAVRQYGQPHHPETGQTNQAILDKVLFSTLSRLGEQGIDAVIFTDLIERKVYFQKTSTRIAKWDGVSRKPRLRGGATGVSEGFDWTRPATASSLAIGIYSTHTPKHLFYSVAGIEVTRDIDSRSGKGKYVRREKLFNRQQYIDNAIELAFHPFIQMEEYPGEKKP